MFERKKVMLYYFKVTNFKEMCKIKEDASDDLDSIGLPFGALPYSYSYEQFDKKGVLEFCLYFEYKNDEDLRPSIAEDIVSSLKSLGYQAEFIKQEQEIKKWTTRVGEIFLGVLLWPLLALVALGYWMSTKLKRKR